ncbi:structural protein [Enterococcus faecalis]|uniref:structural protein n=1 Tax=Enterococcus faecalis TaxID=1351 RepID=UPI004042C38C
MSEVSLFYEGVLQDDGTYDRAYTAADWAQYFANIFHNGVMMSVGEALRVTAADAVGMRVIVRAGAANLKGYQYINTAALTLPIEVASSTQDRTDSIVIRHDLNKRSAYVAVKKGNLTVERTPDIFEIQLATIRIPRNESAITAALITDKRSDTKVCGYATPFAEVSVSGLEAQYEAILKKIVEANQTDSERALTDFKTYIANTRIETDATIGEIIRTEKSKISAFDIAIQDWFSHLKNDLGSNQAINLQNQIQLLTADTALATIEHTLTDFPMVRALAWDYGAGVAPVGQETTGAGGGHPITIPVNVEYLSRKALKVHVPLEYGLINPTYTKIDERHHRFISGFKTIEISLGGI